jgi:NAD-dependent dihydropyrimidine dehydrogenase PreA subunit
MHKACVQECPVDCIYEGARSMYINPDECVDCGACKLICEVDEIYYETDLPDDEQQHLADNAAFFNEYQHTKNLLVSYNNKPLGFF